MVLKSMPYCHVYRLILQDIVAINLVVSLKDDDTFNENIAQSGYLQKK